MLRMIKGLLCVALVTTLACLAAAGQLTVTSPSTGDYLGTSNTLTFQITGATYQTTVTATINGASGTTISTSKFTPNSSGEISGSLPITFATTAPAGDYTITVNATSPGTTFNTEVVTVHVIVQAPKFLDFSPISGRYVNGTVKVRATIDDANLKNWKVQVDNADIPNNTGTSTTVAVDWDSTLATNNTSHTIKITATDLAGNTASQSVSVTVDRTKPTITVTYPQSSVAVIAGAEIDVVIDISAASSSVIDQNGIDVLAQTSSGAYIVRVARVSAKSLNSTTLRWTGRIRTSAVKLPKTFNLYTTAIDLAGNVATPSTVTVKLR